MPSNKSFDNQDHLNVLRMIKKNQKHRKRDGYTIGF